MMEELQIILDRLTAMGTDLLRHVPQIAAGLVVLLLTWLVARLFSRTIVKAVARTNLRRSIQDLFTKVVGLAIWLVGILAAAVVVFPTLTPGKFLTVFGIGSVAIGFAFKEVFENFLAGVVILLRDTIELGDFVECGDIRGEVERITVRDTHIRQTDGQRVVLPNAELFKNPVRIVTDRDRRRIRIVCGVAYDEDVDAAREVIEKAVREGETVDADRPVQVFAREFGASSIDFEICWWTGAKPIDERRSRDEVVARVKRALDEAGIEIPFPYRTLTFKEPLRLHDREPAEASA